MAKVAEICEEFAQETTISYFVAKYKTISLKIPWIFIIVGLQMDCNVTYAL